MPALLVYGVLYAFTRQIESYLQQIHPQHLFNPHQRAYYFAVKTVWFYMRNPLGPQYDFIHDFQKFIPFDFFVACLILC